MKKQIFFHFALLFCCITTNAYGTFKVADSAAFYIKKYPDFKKQIKHVYTYCYSIAEIDPDYSLHYMSQMLRKANQNQDSLNLAYSNFLIGYSHGCKENFSISLDYYFKALPYFETHHDTAMLVNTYNNIGIAYSHQKQHYKAIEYFQKTLELSLVINRTYTCGISYNNLAIEYQNLKNYNQSDLYLKKALKVFEELGIKEFFALITINRGVIRFEKAEYDSSLYYYRLAAYYHKTYNKTPLSTSITNNLGENFFVLKQYDSAFYYLNNAISNTDTLNDPYSSKETYSHFAKLYFAVGDYKNAYLNLKKCLAYAEKIYNTENLKKSLAAEANFNLLKKENELKLIEEKRNFERKTNRLIYIFIACAGVLLVASLVILFKRFNEKKLANKILTFQKDKIEEQQREITDSISYAQHIQNTILPPDNKMNDLLKDYVLFYLPKDIVSGDFYYAEKINNKTFISVIDCTGHGVPGGFMSMLAYNAIIKALHDYKLSQPSIILDKLTEILSEHFSKDGSHTMRDGMDMALISVYNENGIKYLEFAGAQNPLWIVDKFGTLNEIKPNKQSIGFVENFENFTNHKIKLQTGDTVYLLSDGYADQFGGPSGKKFKYAQLKLLLQTMHLNSCTEIEQILKERFYEWKDTYAQIDDVCLLGVRIN